MRRIVKRYEQMFFHRNSEEYCNLYIYSEKQLKDIKIQFHLQHLIQQKLN